MKQAAIEFIDFLRHPQRSFRSNHKVCTFVLSWAMMMLLPNTILLALNIVFGHLGLNLPERAPRHYEGNHFWFALLFVPFFEEMACRLYLIPNKRNISLSSVTLAWIICLMIVKVPDSPVKRMIVLFFSSVAIAILLFLGANKLLPKIKYAYLFYFSALLFGFLHFQVFLYESVSFFSILYIFFYLIGLSLGGVILGYIRVSLGIVYSILLHFSINFLPMMAMFGKL